MNSNKLFSAAIFALFAMSSCTSEDEFFSTKSEYVNTVRVSVEDFIPESSATRTAYTVDNTGFHFQWVEGDALGIYPVGGDQVKFPISSGDGSASAAFDGGAWKLRSEYQYAAYYPFSANNYTITESALPANFTGQTQNGNGSTAHLGAYDYLACAATAPDANGGVDMTMKHLGAFLRLQLTMPQADTYSSVVLESDGAEFVAAGTFDLTAATPAITSTATSATYTINLTNVVTTEKNQVITVYAIVAPADLSSNNIKVTVHGTGQTTYVQTVAGKNFAARSAYNIAIVNFPSGTNASGEDVGWNDEPANMENGHAYVDLGLPSGLKWATMNVGATTPEGYGDYFAWGETEPYYTAGHSQDSPCSNWKTGKSAGYDWASYKWCNGSSTTMTKYCTSSSYGTVDNKTTLELADDAAHVNWGGDWRMPTKAEQEELLTNCTCTWTTQNDVKGYKVVGKNGNSIFLPAAGYRYSGNLYLAGSYGYCWSSSLYSTLYSSDPGLAYYLGFGSGHVWCDNRARCSGQSVRAVCP